jgi:hypothetical protein
MTAAAPDAIGVVRSLLADGLDVRDARRSGPLTLVRLVGGRAAPPYVTAAAAFAEGSLEIGEVDGGRVRQLSVRNSGPIPVLLLDGEHLEGAMQDRVLNVSVLAAPRHETVIPVSCVERGRWGYRSASRGFVPAPEAAYAELRAMKAQQIALAARSGAGRSPDQSAVWADIERKRATFGALPSPTGAMGDAYRGRAADVDRIVSGVGAPDGANGVLAFVGWRPLALDVFDRPETLAAVWRRLVGGYAIDAVTADVADVGSEFARGFLRGLVSPDAEVTAHEGVGLGLDVILTTPKSVADGLVWEGAVVHVAAFSRQTTADLAGRPGGRPRPGRIERPTERRSRRGDRWFHDRGGAR